LEHPEYLLFVDETGCNTNQKDDGNAGGELFVLPVDGEEFGVCGVTTDMHFTVLCFTSGLGDPVMCAVILKSNKEPSELPIAWKLGIDIRKDIASGETTYELIKANYGEENAMAGGPKCTYQGKEIPCFVGCSPKASITSEMLAAMVSIIDQNGVYDRTKLNANNKPIQPVLLLDGHQSRLKLPFLRYINDKDHKWTVCLGVPYGTHIWQVADSSELNGCFKIALNKAKREYMKLKPWNNKKWLPTDIIPLINMAWVKSFARVDTARKAIIKRGWYALNYVLLDHPGLIRECVQEENGTNTTTDTTNSNCTNAAAVAKAVNTDGAASSGLLETLLEEKAKEIGRINKYEERKKQQQTMEERYNALTGAGTLTSGQLAINNIWQLNGDELLAKLEEKEQLEQQKRSDSEAKKAAQQEKENMSFTESYHKYRNNQKLAGNDMKHLLRKVREANDSPLRTKIADLRQQWEKRKNRLDLFSTTPSRDFSEVRTNVPLLNSEIGERNIEINNLFLATFAENENSTDELVSHEL
jgi:hypothetical protein